MITNIDLISTNGKDSTLGAESEIPQLPRRIKTTFGVWVDLVGPIWRTPSNAEGMGETTIAVGLLDDPKIRGHESKVNAPTRSSMFHPTLTHLLRIFLAQSFDKISPIGVRNMCVAFCHWERFLFDRFSQIIETRGFGIENLTYDILIAYTIECERHSAAKGANPGIIRRFYRWGVSRKIPDFKQAIYLQMRGVRMQMGLRGHIARFRDPQKGAFTWEELSQIDRNISDNLGDDDGRAIVSIFRELGIRPLALVLLRRHHLERLPTPSGHEFFLRIPRVKRYRSVAAPNNCSKRVISKRLGTLLLKLHAEKPDVPDAPLLPFLSQETSKSPHYQVWHKLRKWADDVDLVTGRLPLNKQGWRDTRYLRNKSPKLARLPITAYRFRRTIATNLAEQGATQDEIAAFLDDKTTAMALVYVENTSLVTDTLAETLDRHPDWIRVINLFRGIVLKPNDISLPEVIGGAPHLSNYEEFSDIGSIGRCGSASGCRLEPPLSCYLCPFFRASQETQPHERQLVQLKREIDNNIGKESDRMAGVFQLNIAAIVQLLERITPSKGAMTEVMNRIIRTRTRHDGNT